MLFEEIDFSKKVVADKLKFVDRNWELNWSTYYNSYNYALHNLFKKDLLTKYIYNYRARPIMFLFRHSLEICLKYNLVLRNIQIPISHNFSQLLEAIDIEEDIPEMLVEIIDEISFDYDGSCFRYYSNRSGEPYFTFDDVITFGKILSLYNQIEQSYKFVTGKICDDVNFDDKRVRWNLTFHMNDCHQLMHIKTQYDQLIEFYIKGVLNDEMDLQKLLLPILFLIRHSLEIGLKYNIEGIQKKNLPIKMKNYSAEHSLARLFNCYKDFLSNIDKSKANEETLVAINDYKNKYSELNETIHILDTNSRYFRYPADKQGRDHEIRFNNQRSIFKILELYYLTDPFITFTNDILEQEGIA